MAVVRNVVGWLNGRPGAVLALAALWIVVIGVGGGRAADDGTWLAIPRLDWLNYVFVGLLILGGIIIVVSILTGPKGTTTLPPPRKRPLWPVLLLLAIFLWFSQRDREPTPDQADAPAVEEAAETEESANGTTAPLGPRELAVLLVMLAAAGTVAAISRRQVEEHPIDEEEVSVEEALSPAVDHAADHLRVGTDPRSAVLLAYDRLEAALSETGRPRQPNETPTEHLRRVLAALAIDTDPLLGLAELYQVARFSTHPVTTADQQRAASALQRVRTELAALR
ncbi:MAG: DUF4129 domain-containing protein [Acidimicrobiales bacterium]